MRLFTAGTIGCVIVGAALLLGGPARAGTAAGRYPAMAPLEQYQMPAEAEIALARSAAPRSISDGAAVMVLTSKGYQPVVDGGNGFVCLVVRSWFGGPDSDEFWNPRLRAPNCFNAASAQSVVRNYVEKTRWVLAGASRVEISARTKEALASRRFVPPAPGAMTYMMSKDQITSDADGHWHPHLMFFVANSPPKAWGANLPGTNVYGDQIDPDAFTIYLVPVGTWSDGEADVSRGH